MFSNETLDELIAQCLNPSTSDVAGHADRVVTARSALPIRPGQWVTTASNEMLAFSDVPVKTPLFCPFHEDARPSAFVVQSRRGGKGIHCSTCAQTFWTADGAEAFDFNDFDRQLHGLDDHYKRHHDYDQLGPILNTPLTKIGLVGNNISIVDGTPAPAELLPGLMMIKSPKGSGKTEAVRRYAAEAKSVLLIGHRRTLIEQSCERLGLRYYLDEAPRTRIEVADRKFGICLDSLLRVVPVTRLDLLILDESEQVLSHLLADTIERRQGGGRNRIFAELGTIVAQAERVVALDADLGWVTFDTLIRMRSK